MNLSHKLQNAASPFSTLRQRNFGLVWSSIMLGGMGAQMETLVMAWFVLTLTDSPFLVGLAGSARMAANILALFAGAIADRMPRHLLLSGVGFVMGSLAIILLALLLTDTLEVWHIFVISFASGLARIFQMPAGQSLAADSVPQGRISTSVALINSGMNLNLIIGPLIGGILFEAFGPEGAYALISALYISSGVCALFIRVSRLTEQTRESVWRLVLGGLRYVKVQQALWAGLLVAVIINLTGFPFHTTLMPIFAKDVLGTDARGLGLLISAFGIGALFGSFALASVQNMKHTGRLLIVAVIVWHASMVVFSTSTSFPTSLVVLVVSGMAFSATLVLILTVLLRTTLPEYRGRIMGLRVLAIYAHTFGSLSSGGMASLWGAPVAANINAVWGVTMLGLLAFIAPKLRRA
ncbi:MAG: MFS transporter [Dehalococcoidia bacterium]